ncbi:putative transferase [Helianthus annuus]|nr:putative transferase [Helianthus annuus]
MVSVRTDVYAYGITLIQLISGRKVVNPNIEDYHQSLRQWVYPLGFMHLSYLYFWFPYV